MQKQSQLCCIKCGSLDVSPGLPIADIQKLPVFCNKCGANFIVDIKIDGIDDDGVLQVTYIPSLIMIEKNKDRIKNFY